MSVPSFRYISWPEYGRLTEALAEKVREGGEEFDIVVGLARGGIPVSMVVSDRLSLDVDFMSVKSYMGIATRGRPRILKDLIHGVRGKRVLLVDDLVDHGDTLALVMRHLQRRRPRLLQTAVIFKKPWSKTEPDYFLEETEKWVVFPFEFSEVESLRKARPGARSAKQR